MSEQRIRGFDVSAERYNFDRSVRIWLYREGLRDVQMVKKIEMVTTLGDEVMEPTLDLERDVAQNLLDALWSAGFRPRNGEGGNAQVTAIKAHLEDMRKLVFEPRQDR